MTAQSSLRQLIRERIAENPSTMTDALARELSISEAEVVRCLPDEMWTEAPTEEFQTIWKTMTGWERITFIARNPGAVVEVSGTLPDGSPGHGMFNLTDSSNPLRGHLMINRLGSILLVSKPFFKLESHSVQFFDTEGEPMFAVYVGRDEKRTLLPSVLEGFMALRDRYATQEAR
ncbi:heme utilization cystosolic carrier protein HutX [Pseudodesulfovibrio sp. F-1]|uniref:Heme utilization cystosolic carrier protein HutX n=1 Tax=Pseudodesulfovibrio alkaliphilus TaxID=2661613 RepID=A0A7K1KRC9_9BACT|nr:heme utilization cystosolic carrier protein HutX [Pseudodesulfovibrio alkaliphilus]MUM78520.1 heme utilization cystosolic carrier protein HutX [Pseudodesulfovibrio alkaliphilus]